MSQGEGWERGGGRGGGRWERGEGRGGERGEREGCERSEKEDGDMLTLSFKLASGSDGRSECIGAKEHRLWKSQCGQLVNL